MPTPLDHWPIFGVRVNYGKVELKLTRESDLFELANLLPDDYEQDPDAEQFVHLSPTANRHRILLQDYWRSLATWSPSSWSADFAVKHDGDLVGMQILRAQNFASTGTVETASWLSPTCRGLGIGTTMRAAVLELAFAGLGARWAVSSAAAYSEASVAVSERLGYRHNGFTVVKSGHGGVELRNMRLHAEQWREIMPEGSVRIQGLKPALDWFR